MQRIAGRKFAITGASRGLGAALAIEMADAGAQLVLLARTKDALGGTAKTIFARTGQHVDLIDCDLADVASVTSAGEYLAKAHSNLDGLIHNGAMWLPGALDEVSDLEIQSCISSAAIGSLILTRHILPVLRGREEADIHTVVSTSGLPFPPAGRYGSVAFAAAKSAQAGLVNGLTEELEETNIRVTAVYPGDFDDLSPTEPAWAEPANEDHTLTNREVVSAILFILNMPPRIAIKSMVIQ
ncbi:MAG: SDR family oxidoreductase [Pikeienuella sp.]